MPWKNNPDLIAYLGAFLLSMISGAISILQRITRGQPAKPLWVVGEIFTSLLCGVLVYDAYPVLQESLPVWVTWPIAVSFAAYMGSTIFRMLEYGFYSHFKIPQPPQK